MVWIETKNKKLEYRINSWIHKSQANWINFMSNRINYYELERENDHQRDEIYKFLMSDGDNKKWWEFWK